jgi:hypothetical protein
MINSSEMCNFVVNELQKNSIRLKNIDKFKTDFNHYINRYTK